MFFYNWREMVLWTSIFAIAIAIIAVGVRDGGDSHVLRLAIGPKDSFQDQLGQDIKALIERRTPYRVSLIHSRDSQSAQQLLLDKKADLAVLAPAALHGSQQTVTVAPLASVHAHLMIETKSTNTSLFQVGVDEIGLGEPGSDSVALGLSLLEALGLANTQGLRLNDDTPMGHQTMLLTTDHVAAPQWNTLLQDARYRMLSLREAAAIVSRHPLWAHATVPAYVHAFPGQQLPETDISTVATPAVMALLKDAPAVLATELSGVMNSPEGHALSVRYGAEATRSVWNLLPKHNALGGDALPVREQLQQELAWWIQHKTMAMLIILGVVLLGIQTRVISNSRRDVAVKNVTEQVEKLLDQLIHMEQRARTDNDLRALYQLQEEVNHIKLQGCKLMIGSPLTRDPLMGNFQLQCQLVMTVIEKRLSGRPPLAAVA